MVNVFGITNCKMLTSHTTFSVSVAAFILLASLAHAITYPRPARGTVQDNYFGTTVQDPYRWMEDTGTEATKSFVNAQNALSASYFEQCPFREQIEDRLYDAYDYSRFHSPQKRGKYTFQFRAHDRKEQKVLVMEYVLEGINITIWRVLLDPNTFSDDGTITLTNLYSFSKDGEMFAYGTSVRGSDWRTVYFRNVSTTEIIDDVLTKVKFSKLVWKGNEGVFYGHFPDFEGNPEGNDTGTNVNHKISYHRVGTPQTEDVIVAEFLDKPHSLINNIQTTRNEEYLIVNLGASADGGSWEQNTVYYVNLTGNNPAKWQTRPLVKDFIATFNFIADVNGILYFHTNFNAPRYKIVGIRLSSPDTASWTTLVEEDVTRVLVWAAPVNKIRATALFGKCVGKLVLRSLIEGNLFTKDIAIEKGSVSSYEGEIDDSILFITFESYFVANRIYKLDFATNVSDIQLKVHVSGDIKGVDPEMFQINQVWYSSKDGTQVPMYIMHKKDLVLDGSPPAMLYGYGGFNVNYLLDYSAPRIVFIKSLNSVAVIANIRGGGEYGDAWHKAGSLLNKQNTFDDFHAAAEYLIANNYTSASKMIIEGASNGGLLVVACVNQRPELYGAAIASVGAMDMLRYQKFTVGHAWVPEFGSSDDPIHFENIYKYSPLHNIQFPIANGTQYPAILVMAGDHDDRAVPSHSYKYIAELQYKIGSNEKQVQCVDRMSLI